MKTKPKPKRDPLAMTHSISYRDIKRTRVNLGHGGYKKTALPLSDGTR